LPDLHSYSNDGAVALQAAKALEDADKCISLSPDFVKGHFRRGIALIALERFEEGAASLSKVLDMDPKNAEAKASLQMAQVLDPCMHGAAPLAACLPHSHRDLWADAALSSVCL
jgi:tetratricopeptide (TPR) repeat protein